MAKHHVSRENVLRDFEREREREKEEKKIGKPVHRSQFFSLPFPEGQVFRLFDAATPHRDDHDDHFVHVHGTRAQSREVMDDPAW